ncbi:MAG: oxidoreductase [Phycicoccus sp.]
METIYAAAGGHDGLLALARAWHERCLADDLLEHPFSRPGHPEHLTRLAAYWGEALGGPPAYTGGMADETHMLRLHAGNGEHPDMDERGVELFDAAMDDVRLTEPRLRGALHDYFAWSVRRIADYPDSPEQVPDRMTLPHWSWDGPARV